MESLSDKDIVDGIIKQEKQIVRYFFYKKCIPLFGKINKKIFNSYTDDKELIDEFYLYLHKDNWRRLRSFNDQKGKLITWISTTATRFFIEKSKRMRRNRNEKMLYIQDMQNEAPEEDVNVQDKQKPDMDVETMLNLLPDGKQREVIRRLFVENEHPQKIAANMNITVDNVYNIKARALKKLRQILTNTY
jgi:RNA polymerase sigma factor (sigma-70 family)